MRWGGDHPTPSADPSIPMLLPHPFRRFIAHIRPDRAQLNALRKAHLELSQKIRQQPELQDILVSIFLQGSYRRSTAIRRPRQGGVSDVDLVLVTRLDPVDFPPEKALRLLDPFLRRHYSQIRQQGRSIGLRVGDIDIDLVLASAPSRVELYAAEYSAEPLEDGGAATPAELMAWKSEPLLIPDGGSQQWEATNPLAQVARTRDKNGLCNAHYLGVVKALKWWKMHDAAMPEHPRGYPLERLIEECCPDGIESVDEGVTRTLEEIARRYSGGKKPRLEGHAVPGQDVFARVPADDFRQFSRRAREAAMIARRALDGGDPQASAVGWQCLFGEAFPRPAIGAEAVEPDAAPASRSVEELLREVRERGSVLVSGLEELQRLKRMLERAVHELGIRIVWDPNTPAELKDYVGAMALSAIQYGLAGAAGGMVAGVIFKDRSLANLGAVLGAVYGAIRGYNQVEEGWRVRSWYERETVCVEVVRLSAGKST